MSLLFSTGVTPSFEPRATRFWPSIRQHRIPFLVHLVDYGDHIPPIYAGIATKRVRYADVRCKVHKTQMQHGAFTQFWTGPEDAVVAYCDADAYFQRPPTAEETAMMEAVGENEFMAGRNNPDPNQTLENEATLIGPNLPRAEIDQIWPGYHRMLCRNFGFVVARVSTWKRIYGGVIRLWPAAHRCFWNPAVVQFVSLYSAYSQGMRCTDLPASVHTHAHLGLPDGVKNEDGIWKANGQSILFCHAL